jgi:hypothetical protein
MRKNKIQSKSKKSKNDEQPILEIDNTAEPERLLRNEFLHTKKKRGREQEEEEILDINNIINYKSIFPQEEKTKEHLIDKNITQNNFSNFKNFQDKHASEQDKIFITQEAEGQEDNFIYKLKNQKSKFNPFMIPHRTIENFPFKRDNFESRLNFKYSQFVKGKIQKILIQEILLIH